MIKKQFTLYMENKPGVLSRITKQLADNKINIEGISVSESTDVGLIQIVPSNTATAKKVLNNVKVPYTVQDVAIVSLPNKPGELARLVNELSKAKININYIYATGCTAGSECECHVVISAPNLKKVEAACKKLS